MRAGAMRENLIFTEYTETQSSSGAVVKRWVEKYRCKAMIKRSSPVFDKDGVEAKEEYSGVNLYFIVRMADVIHEKMRVKHGAYRYEILLMEPNYSDRTLLIQTRRVNE